MHELLAPRSRRGKICIRDFKGQSFGEGRAVVSLETFRKNRCRNVSPESAAECAKSEFPGEVFANCDMREKNDAARLSSISFFFGNRRCDLKDRMVSVSGGTGVGFCD